MNIMTNKKAMEIVLKLAGWGEKRAACYGYRGKRLTDKEREQHLEAIYQIQDYQNDVLEN